MKGKAPALHREVKSLMEKYKAQDFVLVVHSEKSGIYISEVTTTPQSKHVFKAVVNSLSTIPKNE